MNVNYRTPLRSSWLNVLVGVWLVLSPFVIGFVRYPAGLVNNIAVGIALIIVTLMAARIAVMKALVIFLGAWMYASSLILYVPEARYLWNNLILAVVVIIAEVASEAPWPDNYSPKS